VALILGLGAYGAVTGCYYACLSGTGSTNGGTSFGGGFFEDGIGAFINAGLSYEFSI